MTAPLVRKVTIREGDPFKVMARVVGQTNQPITRVTIGAGGSIDWKLFNLRSETPGTVIRSGSLTYTEVLFDELQTPSDDAAWSEDDVGYNFAAVFDPSIFVLASSGPGLHRLEIRGTPASGSSFWIGIWDVEILDVLTSLA